MNATQNTTQNRNHFGYGGKNSQPPATPPKANPPKEPRPPKRPRNEFSWGW